MRMETIESLVHQLIKFRDSARRALVCGYPNVRGKAISHISPGLAIFRVRRIRRT